MLAGVITFFSLNRLLCDVTFFFLIFFILILFAILLASNVTIRFIPSRRLFELATVATASTRDLILVTVTRTLPRPGTRTDPTRSFLTVSSLRRPSAFLHVVGLVFVVVGTPEADGDDFAMYVADAVAVVVVDGE